MNHSRRCTRRPLVLEPLEDRFLLATCHVVRLADLPGGHDLGNGHARGSLRYCITFANTNPGPDTIDFSVTGTIQLTYAGLPTLQSDMTISGPGADLLAVRTAGLASGHEGSIFVIDQGATVAISGLTITNGWNPFGASGVLNSGTAMLKDCTISKNLNWFGDPNLGGGVWNTIYGKMTISGCTISENEATLSEGSSFGGGILNSGVLQIENSTISGNRIDGGGGAGIFNQGSLDIRFSTVTGNYSSSCFLSEGQGLHNHEGSLLVYNTIVAGNGDGPWCSGGPDIVGSYTGSANLVGGDPKLGPLAYNGGHTMTHALLPGSPALNAGDNTGAPSSTSAGRGFHES